LLRATGKDEHRGGSEHDEEDADERDEWENDVLPGVGARPHGHLMVAGVFDAFHAERLLSGLPLPNRRNAMTMSDHHRRTCLCQHAAFDIRPYLRRTQGKERSTVSRRHHRLPEGIGGLD